MRWVHFIHNKINVALQLPEITMEEGLSAYYDNYKPKIVKTKEQFSRREKITCVLGILVIAGGLYCLYDK